MMFLLHIDIKLWGQGKIDHEAEKESIQMITIKYCHKKKQFKIFNYLYELEHLYLCLCTARLSNNMETSKFILH